MLYLANKIRKMENNKPKNETEFFRSLKSRAASKGLSLRAACIAANVSYSTVSKWKRETPHSIDILSKLEDVINGI